MDGRLDGVARAGHAVREFCLLAGLDETAAGDLELATVEAANNIIIHGYEGAGTAHYQVTIALRDNEVQVVLSDSAPSMPAEVLALVVEWSADAPSARGVAIIRACTDRLEYRRRRGRNHLLLGKRLGSESN